MTSDDIVKSYEYMSKQIEREDGLINTRITWMLTFEGFLFAALAIVAGKDDDPNIQFVLNYCISGISCYSSRFNCIERVKRSLGSRAIAALSASFWQGEGARLCILLFKRLTNSYFSFMGWYFNVFST